MANRTPQTPALHRKSESARRANQIIRGRTLLMMLVMGVGTFLLLFWKLYDLQINRHDEMQARAVTQQTRETKIIASRGTIYDKNHNILASSTTAEMVILDPLRIGQYVESQEEAQEEAAARALEEGEAYTPQPIRDQSYIARGLSRILDMDQASIEKKMENTKSEYVILSRKVEKEAADEIRRFLNGEIDEEGNEVPEGQRRSVTGVHLNPDSKRYYPYNAMAANVLGFVDIDSKGAVGLEVKYNEDLSGTAGRTISAKNNKGQPLLFQYEQYFDAENGSDLVLTLDINVQIALEKGMESMLSKFDAAKGGTGIVMDVNSAAILGMASYPNYDSNQSGVLYDEKLKSQLEKQLADIEENRAQYEAQDAAKAAAREEAGVEKPEEEVSSYEAAVTKAKTDTLHSQWRNKCIDSTYEPGSTFKPITLAAALEEGVINMNSTYDCSGSLMVKGWDKPFNCSRTSGHGHQVLKEAVGNSCNPAFIRMGLDVGRSTFYDYLEEFGLFAPTGVDLQGEGASVFAKRSVFESHDIDLACYAFGQNFNVTPIQLITAQAACVNGGYLYQPYVVEMELDSEGNVVRQHDATPVRQVISEETSAMVRECLEYVVTDGGGKNAQVAGYRIGGKTGTADQRGTKTADNPRGDVVVSFLAVAPADDPQIIMLLTMDTPARQEVTGIYTSGGNYVAPTASKIMADILPYLGIAPQYDEETRSVAEATVPYVVGLSKDDAAAKLTDYGFSSYRTVGDGDTVTDQTPDGGAIVPNGAEIILYMGAEKSSDRCIVPKVTNMSADEANRALVNAGLIMKATGSSASGAKVISQSLEPGTEADAGTVVTVQMGTMSNIAD